jgi:hypothetical protein
MNDTTRDIRCPACGGRARFEEPFEFYSSRQPVPGDESRPRHRWGGWIVVERFPAQFPWVPPHRTDRDRSGEGLGGSGYPLLTHGLVQCPHCHVNRKHTLQWPEEAYWQWPIRGERLWACDRSHAEAILAFIESDHRPSRKGSLLRRLPARFLTAKVRDLVVRKLRQSLAGQDENGPSE